MNSHLRTCCFLISFLVAGVLSAQENDPNPNPQSVVVAGNARFTVLTPEIIRMEWNELAKFEDRASLVVIHRNLPAPPFTVNTKGGELVIKTDRLTLKYKTGSGKFTANNFSVSFNLNKKLVEWKPGMADPLNLKGTTRTLDGTDGQKDVQLEDGLISRNGWFLYDDTKGTVFDANNWVQARSQEEKQDWYFFGYGHDYKKALFDYTRIAGKIPLPPRFAFGYWWSRYWAYSDQELRTLIHDLRAHQVPIDVLVIDMDWHNTYSLSLTNPRKDEFGEPVGWTGYSWNRQLFPDPDKFLTWTDQEKLKTALNLHPASGIAPMEDIYSDFAKAYGFDTTDHKNIPMRIEDKKWVDIYFNKVLHPIEKQGIDFWWLDWQQWLENKSIKNLSNTSWLNHLFFTDMEKAGQKRPLLFHRWGGMGNHRYQIGFSGDSHSTWEALDYEPAFTANAANVGYGYWSHDIGGHIGDDSDPELYLRWIQFGAFSPVLRTHCSKSKDIERRIFMYPKHFPMMLDALQLRYALNPYIYTAARKAFDTGLSVCRPMYYDYPETDEAYQYDRQYFFGDQMIVAPIGAKSENGMSLKTVWLPEGDWYDFYTGSMLKGNKVYTRSYSLNEFPVFVKSGSIIPMYPKSIHNLQESIYNLNLYFIPGLLDSSIKVYEDAGNDTGYKSSEYAFLPVKKHRNLNGSLDVTIAPVEGKYPGMKEQMSFTLTFPSTLPPQNVSVNGKSYSFTNDPSEGHWTYDADQLALIISIPLTPRNTELKIQITPDDANSHSLDLTDGIKGLNGRVGLIMEKLKYAMNTVDPFANLSNNILKMGALTTNIRNNPFATKMVLQEFRSHYDELINDIKNDPKLNKSDIDEVMQLFVFNVTRIPAPHIQLSKDVSADPIRVTMQSEVPDARIYYTLDGTEPTEKSILYIGEFMLPTTAIIKAKCLKNSDMKSDVTTTRFHRKFAGAVSFVYPYHPNYTGGNPLALNDGVFGTSKAFRTNWIGFETSDMVATVELEKETRIHAIKARFLESNSQWIFAPLEVIYEVSTDGKNYKKVYFEDRRPKSTSFTKEDRIIEIPCQLEEERVKFIKVTAKNMAVCPEWHFGKGGKAWLFTDELIVE